jgi:hypothetical protein
MPEFPVKIYAPRRPRRPAAATQEEDRSQRERAKDMPITMYHANKTAVWADALFVSVLQRSDQPGAGEVRQAIAAAVRAHGDQGCAQRVAQEFGDHPETAVARMHWARAVASMMPGSPSSLGATSRVQATSSAESTKERI